MDFVLDASIAACWALRDEDHPKATVALKELRLSSCVVPGIWWFEIRNILLTSERRKRIAPEESAASLRRISKLRIVEELNRNDTEILRLARKHRLTFYDASYLELAFNMNLPIATLDSDILRAAKAESIALLE